MSDDLPGPEANPACFCPMTGLLETLGSKYAMQVVCAVGAHGQARFSDVDAAIPDASTSTLSTRLEELAEAGLVTRTQYDEVPPRVEYELTDDGLELSVRLLPVLAWVCEREGLVAPDDVGEAEGVVDVSALASELEDLLD